jgi:hypothetical protein
MIVANAWSPIMQRALILYPLGGDVRVSNWFANVSIVSVRVNVYATTGVHVTAYPSNMINSVQNASKF